jgi:hypothetical protein
MRLATSKDDRSHQEIGSIRLTCNKCSFNHNFLLKAILNIALAFSIFISSAGFWIEGHYCQEQGKKTSLFSFFSSCCDDGDTASCSDGSKKQTDHDEHGDCCTISISFHKVDFKPIILSQELTTSYKLFVVHPNSISAFKSILPCEDDPPLSMYVPPPISWDCQIQFQVFLC